MNDRTIGDGNNIDGKTQSDEYWFRKHVAAEYDIRWSISSFEKTLTFSTEAGKAIIYINGGAAVAMLTFCGKYIGKINFWSILSLGSFGIGALLGAVALIIAYGAQRYFTDGENKTGSKYNFWALFFGGVSGLLFLTGLLSGALAIWAFNGASQQF